MVFEDAAAAADDDDVPVGDLPLTGVSAAQAIRVANSGFNSAGNAAIAMAQNAANQVASAVRPGASPLSMLTQAADSGDRIAALIAAVTGGSSDPKN